MRCSRCKKQRVTRDVLHLRSSKPFLEFEPEQICLKCTEELLAAVQGPEQLLVENWSTLGLERAQKLLSSCSCTNYARWMAALNGEQPGQNFYRNPDCPVHEKTWPDREEQRRALQQVQEAG